jgi:hypothetical protein
MLRHPVSYLCIVIGSRTRAVALARFGASRILLTLVPASTEIGKHNIEDFL